MLRGAGSLNQMRGTWWVSAEEQFTLVQIPNSHSLGLKTVNNSVTGVEEITPEQSSLSLTTSLKLFITQMHDRGFGLIGPRQVHAEYKMHTRKLFFCTLPTKFLASL